MTFTEARAASSRASNCTDIAKSTQLPSESYTHSGVEQRCSHTILELQHMPSSVHVGACAALDGTTSNVPTTTATATAATIDGMEGQGQSLDDLPGSMPSMRTALPLAPPHRRAASPRHAKGPVHRTKCERNAEHDLQPVRTVVATATKATAAAAAAAAAGAGAASAGVPASHAMARATRALGGTESSPISAAPTAPTRRRA